MTKLHNRFGIAEEVSKEVNPTGTQIVSITRRCVS
jgi:hypothetical protein